MMDEKEHDFEDETPRLGVGIKSGSPPPNTKGWRAPWRRTWGSLSDGRSKVSRRARKHEKDLVDRYQPRTPDEKRQVRRAAELQALADQTVGEMGKNPRATPRRLTALERTADGILDRMAARRTVREAHDPDNLLGALERQNGVTP
jgi:hypothetical protein